MKKEENFGTNYHNQNKFSNGTKLTAIILFVLLIAVVSIFSKKSYASETDKTINASLLNGSFNLLFENSNDIMMGEINESIQDTVGLLKGIRKLNFYEDENGNLIHYKAKILDGKLTELYIDGEKVPSGELLKYENKIQKKVDEYESALKEYRKVKKEYKKLSKDYNGKMQDLHEKLRDLRADNFDFDFDFDRHIYFDIPKPDLSELRESMRELRHNLRGSFADRSLVIPPIHIPEIDIHPIQIPPVPPAWFNDEDWDKWSDEFKENMKEFKSKMKDHNWNMEEFNESMRVFSGKMKEFGLEMKKFGSFVKEMKRELIEDGIINSGDDIDELLLSEDKMEVNGKTVSADLHKKYKNMYEKHTGKKIDGKNKIRIKD
ncbi:MAG: hypothetical protein GYA14_05690 [Ignavibacteria bacterium]|nr:hypothetical protein [Ignavibacteria bacterium]